MIAAPKAPQAIRLLSPGAATQRLAVRCAMAVAIVVASYILVVTLTEVAAIAARMQ